MNKKLVEVVITHWKRPNNVIKIINSLRLQTVPITITICDGHDSEKFKLDSWIIHNVDRIITLNNNYGPFNRYIPIGLFDHEYTFFLDDDVLPGCRCVEWFLHHANLLTDFGVLGEFGRLLDKNGIYKIEDVPRWNMLKEVDIVIRAYFVKTKYLSNIIKLKTIFSSVPTNLLEDDILLCASMKMFSDLWCFLVPHSLDLSFSVDTSSLEEDFALSGRVDHRQRRINFVSRLIMNWWRPNSLKNKFINKKRKSVFLLRHFFFRYRAQFWLYLKKFIFILWKLFS